MKPLTLDEIDALLEGQDADLTQLAHLAHAIPADVTLPGSELEQLEEVTEPREDFGTGLYGLPSFSIRA